MADRQDEHDYRDVPLYWLAQLDRAVGEGDFESAIQAQRELKRLGVFVKYTRPWPSTRKAVAHE